MRVLWAKHCSSSRCALELSTQSTKKLAPSTSQWMPKSPEFPVWYHSLWATLASLLSSLCSTKLPKCRSFIHHCLRRFSLCPLSKNISLLPIVYILYNKKHTSSMSSISSSTNTPTTAPTPFQHSNTPQAPIQTPNPQTKCRGLAAVAATLRALTKLAVLAVAIGLAHTASTILERTAPLLLPLSLLTTHLTLSTLLLRCWRLLKRAVLPCLMVVGRANHHLNADILRNGWLTGNSTRYTSF